MTTSQLCFPIIVFGVQPSGTFDIRVDEEALLTATPLALQSGIYNASLIVDTSGCSYKINSVKQVQRSRLPKFLSKVLNQPVTIGLQLDKCIAMEISDFKRRLATAFQDQEFLEVWEDAGLDTSDFQASVMRSDSFKDIIDYLLEKSGSGQV